MHIADYAISRCPSIHLFICLSHAVTIFKHKLKSYLLSITYIA